MENLHDLIRNIFGNPIAYAILKGSTLAPNIKGIVYFFPKDNGTVVVAEFVGLPTHVLAEDGEQPIGPFGFHIHEGKTCGEFVGEKAFEAAGSHYNPTNLSHPNHVGDLPVIFSNDGYAWIAAYTNRFKPYDVIGYTIVLHQSPDDFRTQPSGNSGFRIACGVIEKAK